MLMVSNHISWLDIPVLHAARHSRFISKSDVKGWPLIGTLATAAGTLYIERTSRRDARRMVQRSEEHTSELQSPCNLVCRLLLEKKKNKTNAQPQQVTASAEPDSNLQQQSVRSA